MAITKHVYQIFIKATPEHVWEAIIEPSWTRRYFHGTAFDSPPVKGQPYRTTIADGRPAVRGRAAGGGGGERGEGPAQPTRQDGAPPVRRSTVGRAAEPCRMDHRADG